MKMLHISNREVFECARIIKATKIDGGVELEILAQRQREGMEAILVLSEDDLSMIRGALAGSTHFEGDSVDVIAEKIEGYYNEITAIREHQKPRVFGDKSLAQLYKDIAAGEKRILELTP